MPGWDDTPGLDLIDDIHDMAFYYQDVLDALEISSINVAGHSVGGMFAAELAAARPRVCGALLSRHQHESLALCFVLYWYVAM